MKVKEYDYDFSFLRGKIVERCGNSANFAKKMGFSKQSLSEKLNNKRRFSVPNVMKAIDILSLDAEEIKKCFFCTKKVD